RGSLQNKNVWQFINNEEDYLYCCMIDAWRRGQACDAVDMARHLMDIDYIDYSDDPARHGATCPHAEQHTNGEVYTSHQWCQGLLYFYLATGDEEALRISKRIGDCLHWWITGPRRRALRCSGRETAWPLLSLSALYEVTGERRYRQAALRVVDDLIAIEKKHGRVVWEYPPGSGIHSGYMLPMTFNGIWDVWAATGEKRVLQLWKSITKPVIDVLERPEDWGYVIFRNWQIKVADLTVLVRWYELTGDQKYIALGKNGLRLILASAPQLDSQFQGFFAMWYRHLILYLKYADEFGMIDDNHCTLVW
ncbi:glycoside hydrolase family 127 protein, partial [bacterium]|nr:glycoside hydrolase family 127 protein [bacterium]